MEKKELPLTVYMAIPQLKSMLLVDEKCWPTGEHFLLQGYAPRRCKGARYHIWIGAELIDVRDIFWSFHKLSEPVELLYLHGEQHFRALVNELRRLFDGQKLWIWLRAKRDLNLCYARIDALVEYANHMVANAIKTIEPYAVNRLRRAVGLGDSNLKEWPNEAVFDRMVQPMRLRLCEMLGGRR